MKEYDILIIGGGHAGVEAAAIAARSKSSVGLISFSKENLGVLSCNPSIGGLGKGHLVREIDALDGIMATCADHAGIHFRVLNRSKGAAVQEHFIKTPFKTRSKNMTILISLKQKL